MNNIKVLNNNTSDENQIEIINKQNLFDLVCGNKEMLKELINIYFNDIPDYISQIKDAIDNLNYKKLFFAAHSIKGMSRNISATGIVQLALNLETMGKEEKIESASIIFEKLILEIDNVKKELNKLID